MSPTPLHPKTQITTNVNKGQPPLKINRDSHSIKKTSSSSSSSSSLSVNKPPQQRQPVIIYTHSPKIIQTHPRNFMELVQKLTGLSRSEEEEEDDDEEEEEEDNGGGCKPPQQQPPPKQEPADALAVVAVCKEENETTSVITDENNCGCSCMDEVKSCFVAAPPILMEPPPLIPYVKSLPVFAPTSAEFLYSNKSFLNYADPLFF